MLCAMPGSQCEQFVSEYAFLYPRLAGLSWCFARSDSTQRVGG